ncbi:MAG: hypothetical protein ACRDZW_01800, partial [Acidimicrobiales bacterium]
TVDIGPTAEKVRGSDLSARYLVVSNAETVSTVPTRSLLYRLLATPGSHLVIDQLPLRRTMLGLPPFSGDAHDQTAVRRAV